MLAEGWERQSRLDLVAHGVVGVVGGTEVEAPPEHARRSAAALEIEHDPTGLEHVDIIVNRLGGADVSVEEVHAP